MDSTPHVMRLEVPRVRLGRRARQGSVHVAFTLLLLLCWPQSAHEDSGTQPAFVGFLASSLMKQLVICFLALFGGLAMYGAGGAETPSILLVYFGAQTGMNLYMKNVLSKIVVDSEEGLKGLPMGFLLTSLQQFVAVITFGCILLLGRLMSSGYEVVRLDRSGWVSVMVLGVAFGCNISLNNFSLSLVAISINMIIRSCLPLATAILQTMIGKQSGFGFKQWFLMVGGVGCAGIASWAKSHAHSDESASLVFGVCVTVISIFAGALNMVLAAQMQMRLNPLDTTCYMAPFAGLFLLLPSLFYTHPVSQWPNHGSMTDWEILSEVWQKNPLILMHLVISGVLSLFYNTLQYTLVHKLSATHATFAGNFNKAAIIALSLLLGLETLPTGHYCQIFVLAVLGNILCFTAFSISKVK